MSTMKMRITVTKIWVFLTKNANPMGVEKRVSSLGWKLLILGNGLDPYLPVLKQSVGGSIVKLVVCQ